MNPDIQAFFKYFNLVSLDDFNALFKVARIKKIKRGEHIVTEGQIFTDAIFVLKGVLRNYMVDSEGNEKTLKFTIEKNQTGVPECLFNNAPSLEYIQALEDSTLIFIDKSNFQQISKNRPLLLRFVIENMESSLCEMVERIRFFTMLTPEQRYLALLKENKSLVYRVEDRYLASYIGVTAVSFSRIKKRTANNV